MVDQHQRGFYKNNFAAVEVALSSLPPTERDLLVAFKTIADYRSLLFDPNINLANDLTIEYINSILIEDFNQVINNLRDYRGLERRGVREALDLVEGALKELYVATSAKSGNKRVNALISCRGKLDSAYQQLEYLNQKFDKLFGDWEGQHKGSSPINTKAASKKSNRTRGRSGSTIKLAATPILIANTNGPMPNVSETPEASGRNEDTADATPSKPIVDGVALSDVYSQKDLLGYKDYVEALASFIESPKTNKPLTIGIEAAWGGGKTTLMRMLEERLGGEKQNFWDRLKSYFINVRKTGSLRPIIPQFKTVWFDAWLYDKEEALWAALALEIWAQAGKKVNFLKRCSLALRLNLKRIDWANFFSDILKALFISLGLATLGYLGFAGLSYWFGKTPIETINWLQHYAKVFAGLSLVTITYTIIKDIAGIIIFPFRSGITRYLHSPDYAAKVGFVREFQQDFKFIVESITQKGKWPLVIFIDDLDRCTPNKAAEVIEAINLLLDSEYSVFIVGMDTDMLCRSIQAKYKDLLPFFNDVGYSHNIGRNFLEKIVQIDFRIPRPDTTRIKDFIGAQLGKPVLTQKPLPELQTAVSLLKAEQRSGKSQTKARETIEQARPDLKGVMKAADKEVRESSFEEFPEVERAINDMAPYLNYNPRRIKRFINIFRLQALIAYHRNLLETSISYDNLARWVVVSMRWPEFLDAVILDSRVISRVRVDIRLLSEKMGKARETTLERIRIRKPYSELLIPLLTDHEFENLLATITGKAIEAQIYLYLSQIGITS